jgi:hypothetical protein
MKRRQHNAGGSGVIIVFLYLLALAAAITKSHAWIMIRPQQQQQQRYSSSSSCATIITSSKSTNINRGGRGRELYRSTTSRSWQKCEKEHTPTTTTTRLYSSGSNGNNNNNNNGDGDDNNNFFSKAINAVKSFLPNQLFDGSESSSSGNENESNNNKKQESQIEQQQQQQTEMTNEFSGSLKEILKDAPLGVRMMGEIISPIIGGLLSTVGGIVAEQQRTIEDVIADAKIYMQLDQSVTDMLGTTTISLGSPTSQSSSTSIINGNAQSRIELTIPVYAGSSYSTSTVQVLAINNVITQMELNDNGRRISVSLASQSPTTYSTDTSNISSTSSSSSSSSSKTMSRGNDDDDMIIEAEIIDKQTKQ